MRAFQQLRIATLGVWVFAAAGLTLTAVSAGGCKEKSAEAGANPEARQHFATVCARCHGMEGRGGPAAAGAPAPRDFHDQSFQRSRTDADIAKVITGGKPPGMPAFGGTLSDDQINGLVQVVRAFGREESAPTPR